MRTFLFFSFIFIALYSNGQNSTILLSKAVQKVYNEYKLYFDSSLLDKYVVLDKTKSYLVNSRTQKIKTIVRADDAFAFDEFSLSFAFVYKADTIKRFPPCRLDTFQNLMALGTPSNPIHHGDALPPYLELIKGNIKFDYKKLKSLLQEMKLESVSIDLKKQSPVNEAKDKREYMWVVTTACPEIKCRELKISAANGKILADMKPE